jgi:hypothetical protein
MLDSSGVYGDNLSFFPELLAPYKIYAMKPRIGAGYDPRQAVLDVTGHVFRNLGGKETIITKLRTENQVAQFYTPDIIPSSLIKQGLYLEDDGELYTFVKDNNFAREGTFTVHDLQLVQGNTDVQTPHPAVNLGQKSFE